MQSQLRRLVTRATVPRARDGRCVCLRCVLARSLTLAVVHEYACVSTVAGVLSFAARRVQVSKGTIHPRRKPSVYSPLMMTETLKYETLERVT